KISFIPSDFKRAVSDAADLILKNRFFEQNPSLTDDGASLIARPGLKYLTTVGPGPIRGLCSEPGAFNGDMFVASGDSLFRVDKNLTATFLTAGLFDPDTGAVNMTITQAIGDVPDYLFIADGRNLRLYNGDTEVVSVISTPDDVGIFDVETIASFVICIPVQEEEFIGRFYWINPGETTIDPLDFATAESYPDRVMGVKRFGDQFWLPGERSTEVWYPTGDPSRPMSRLQGVVFDRGTWEATAVAINETLIVVDGD